MVWLEAHAEMREMIHRLRMENTIFLMPASLQETKLGLGGESIGSHCSIKNSRVITVFESCIRTMILLKVGKINQQVTYLSVCKLLRVLNCDLCN